MSALLASELLKLRTTRVRWAYLGVIAFIAGVATAATIGSADEFTRTEVSFQADLLNSATIAAIVGLIVGITISTGEFRHGTITPTLLVAPVRERVVLSKVIVALLVGAFFALFAVLVTVVIAIPWLQVIDVPLHLGEGDVLKRLGQVVLACALWTALGCVVGSVLHSQVGAIAGSLVWLLIAEGIFGALLGLVDWDGVADYFPGQAFNAVAGMEQDGGLSFWPALAVAVAYVVVIGVAGAVRTSRRDIT